MSIKRNADREVAFEWEKCEIKTNASCKITRRAERNVVVRYWRIFKGESHCEPEEISTVTDCMRRVYNVSMCEVRF